jgi:branched-subunit amino acid transport protein
MEVFILIAAGVVTWMLRASFIVLGNRVTLPGASERVIANARPAMLAALIASTLLAAGGGEASAIPPSWLVATAVAALVAWRSGNLALTCAAGVATLSALSLAGA